MQGSGKQGMVSLPPYIIMGIPTRFLYWDRAQSNKINGDSYGAASDLYMV